MRLLLDIHSLLRFLDSITPLSAAARRLIEAPANSRLINEEDRGLEPLAEPARVAEQTRIGFAVRS